MAPPSTRIKAGLASRTMIPRRAARAITRSREGRKTSRPILTAETSTSPTAATDRGDKFGGGRSGADRSPEPFRHHTEAGQHDRAADQALEHLLAHPAGEACPQVAPQDGGRGDDEQRQQVHALPPGPQG